jgi:hypothetical protein
MWSCVRLASYSAQPSCRKFLDLVFSFYFGAPGRAAWGLDLGVAAGFSLVIAGVPQPVVAAGRSFGPLMVPSARLVRVLEGTEVEPPRPALSLATRNGAGFTFCGALAPVSL